MQVANTGLARLFSSAARPARRCAADYRRDGDDDEADGCAAVAQERNLQRTGGPAHHLFGCVYSTS